ncbi:hypothetical protein [Jeotgalibacillus sp. R-1-5s-1]|uniref:hypothetical protein n=1 Tax=Jeotgalibacillus sp. R-1-5s-1 TaxID=2555897 RepID=UPI00106C9D31|nr:hypothetical protein [Jeotgalibacillus sp. R-1-5s-1]TFD97062.1 hypothetical protein E2491_10240 [Jeotgalibacillus sp. R-1-5s-1]
MKPVFEVQKGFDNPSEALNSSAYKIYRSRTRISSLKFYVGAAKDHIEKSNTIPVDFQKELSKFEGIVSIGRTKVTEKQNSYEFKNVHLYVSNCETLDGFSRICYVYGLRGERENCIMVKECARSRGDNYSAYYKILSSLLKKEEFLEENNEFVITKENISTFISLVNKISNNSQKKIYSQQFTDEIQKVNGSYFNTFYWDGGTNVKYSNGTSLKEYKDPTDNIDSYLEKIFNEIDNTSDAERLRVIGNKLVEFGRFAEMKANLMQKNNVKHKIEKFESFSEKHSETSGT